MNLIKHKGELIQEKKFPGLIEVKFTHEIKSTKADFKYLGPKIPPPVWHSILAFFKWTYDTTHSESQVRLYVNPTRNSWAAWAYPQEARTGMSAREVDNEQMKLQRAQFPDSEGWIYFGTVHHHCGMSAFQSSVDEHNEESQDGLHITVGSMTSPRYDLHCRFYLNGACFDPDMALMWDIGDEARKMFPVKFHNEIARYQLGEPGAVDFPDQWKTNLIEVRPTYQVGGQGQIGFRGESGGSSGTFSYGDSDLVRAAKCAKTILEDVAESPWTLEQLMDRMMFLNEDALIDTIFTNMSFFRIDFHDLVMEWPENKPAKKIFKRALRRYQREKAGLPPGALDLKEEEDDLEATEPGDAPAGEQGGSPPVGDSGQPDWSGQMD